MRGWIRCLDEMQEAYIVVCCLLNVFWFIGRWVMMYGG